MIITVTVTGTVVLESSVENSLPGAEVRGAGERLGNKTPKCRCALGTRTPHPALQCLAGEFRWCGAVSIARRNEGPLALARFVVADLLFSPVALLRPKR